MGMMVRSPATNHHSAPAKARLQPSRTIRTFAVRPDGDV